MHRLAVLLAVVLLGASTAVCGSGQQQHWWNWLSLTGQAHNQRSFRIDYERDTFLLDDRPFRYVAGCVHYFNIRHAYWRDRLLKVRAAGLNAVETYVAWNYHEPAPGDYRWTGDQDLERFLGTAHELGLYVILRIGPFADAEQDMGGLPAWLLRQPDIRLRTSDSNYTAAVASFYTQALRRVKPLLYPNGGPVIMVQVENEYGSFYACDRNYTHWLFEFVKHQLDTDGIVYFTTDGAGVGYLKCGVINGTYATVDFGTSSRAGVHKAFAAQRQYSPRGPLVNSEFYPGWFDSWGQTGGKSTVAIQPVLDTMTYMYQMNASWSFYMFIGGTSFGYQAGGENWSDMDKYVSLVTSYDYDAPLSEHGGLTPKWLAIRQHVQRLTAVANPWPLPHVHDLLYYGPVEMKPIGSVFDLLDKISSASEVLSADYPLSMELLGHYFGLTLYETTVRRAGLVLDLSGVHDRGYVFVNRTRLLAVVQRPVLHSTKLSHQLQPGDRLSLLVENQGRVCYGTYINDTKGVVSNVTLDGQLLRKWTMTPLHPERVARIRPGLLKSLSRTAGGDPNSTLPTFYAGTFQAEPYAGDTYVDTSGWTKGLAFDSRGYNLGRYWPAAGPQLTLYHPFVRPGENRLTFLEYERATKQQTVSLVNYQKWSSPTDTKSSTSLTKNVSFYF